MRETYRVSSIDTGDEIPRQFYYNELLAVPQGTVNNENLNSQKINQLNLNPTRTIPELNVVVTRGRENRRI